MTVQFPIKPLDNQGLPAADHMERNQLFKAVESICINRTAINPRGELEIRRRLDEIADIKVWRDGFERGARSLGRHDDM